MNCISELLVRSCSVLLAGGLWYSAGVDAARKSFTEGTGSDLSTSSSLSARTLKQGMQKKTVMPHQLPSWITDMFYRGALVVIDVQLGFTFDVNTSSADSTYMPRPHADAVMQAMMDFVDRWLQAGGEVVATQYVNPPRLNSPLRQQFGYKRFDPSTEIGMKQVKLDPRLDNILKKEEHSERVFTVEKNTFGAVNDDFETLARAKGWKAFALAGFNTGNCVMSTASQMFDKNYRFIIIEDLCADNGPIWEHNYAIKHMQNAFDPYESKDRIVTTHQLVDALPAETFRPSHVALVEPGPRNIDAQELMQNDVVQALETWGLGSLEQQAGLPRLVDRS